MVDRSWEVAENTPGGSELTVTPQWNGSQELTDFNRDNSGVGRTTDNGVTYEWKDHGPASGTDPYTHTGSIFTNTGVFAVADYYFSIPDNISISCTTIGDSESECFDAKQTIIVAGDGTIVEILSGGEAIFVAGGKIYLKHGFSARDGSDVHAYITIDNQFCGSLAPSMVTYQQFQEDLVTTIPEKVSDEDVQSVNIYPNPTHGRLNIDFFNFTEDADIYIFNFQGQELFRTSNHNRLAMEINIENLPDGIYLIIIKSDDQIISGKLVKS
jgi:hypothetical protein